MSEVLIIGGMHRSGTSLTAEWLQCCGLYLGDELVPADWTNPRGHFEDRSISRLQRAILEAAGVSHYCVEGQPIRVAERFHEEARELIRAREGRRPWGFKDPRTTLLLAFWRALLPEARYLLVFRHYARVVDSLLRRERAFRWNPRKIAFFARVWKRYNRDLLAFAARHPDACLVLDIDELLKASAPVLEYAKGSWGFDFQTVDIRAVADESLLARERMPLIEKLCRLSTPGLQATYESLTAAGTESLVRVAGGGKP